MNNPTHHTCSTCGHTWRHGQHGGHSCATLMAVTIAEQARELAALKAQPSGVVLPDPLKAAIMRTDDVLHALAGWDASSVKLEQRHGADWVKEIDAIRRELHAQLASLNSSPASACDSRKLSDIGNELHNLSCHVVHHNEGWANQLGALASELWYWSASSGAADERAAFEVWAKSTLQGCQLRYVRDALPKDDPRYGEYVSEALRLSWEGWQARAALSATAPDHSEQVRQMVPQLPAFAQKVISKLKRFEECTDDGQGADIGRHWFDLLTQLGLLNRVQRSPGLWEITAQGEDVLAAPSAASQGGDV